MEFKRRAEKFPARKIPGSPPLQPWSVGTGTKSQR